MNTINFAISYFISFLILRFIIFYFKWHILTNIRRILYVHFSTAHNFLQKLCIGGSLDVDMISILTYAIHQASIENLRDLGASPVITDLSSTPRKLSAADMSASISDMFLTEPPYKWQNHSKSIHTPNYFVTIPAVATTAFSVGFDDSVVDTLAPILLNLFGIGQEDRALNSASAWLLLPHAWGWLLDLLLPRPPSGRWACWAAVCAGM